MTALLCFLFGHLSGSDALRGAESEQARAALYNRLQRRVNNAEFWTVDPTLHCARCGKELHEHRPTLRQRQDAR